MLSNKTKAIGYIMLSAFGFALMTAFVRMAGDLPFTQKSLFRNLVAVAVAAVVLKREKVGFRWEKGNLHLLILRATCGTLGIFCNYYAIDHLVLADANILNKMSPFFAILFSLVLLKERANVWQYLSVLAAFGGAMLIIKPGFSADTFPAVIGLLGGMSAGAAYTFVRALSKRNEKSARIVFFFLGFLHFDVASVRHCGLPPDDVRPVHVSDGRGRGGHPRPVRRDARLPTRSGEGNLRIRLYAGAFLRTTRIFPVRPDPRPPEHSGLSGHLRRFGCDVLL